MTQDKYTLISFIPYRAYMRIHNEVIFTYVSIYEVSYMGKRTYIFNYMMTYMPYMMYIRHL